MNQKMSKLLRRHAALSDRPLRELKNWHNAIPKNKRAHARKNLQLINAKLRESKVK